MSKIEKAEIILKKYLLILTFMSLVTGTVVGYHYAQQLIVSKELIKYVIISLAITTLYPSMIRLRISGVGAAIKDVRSVSTALLLTLLVSPLLSMAIANYIRDPSIRLGYVAANIVPASSASVGYVLLADGSIELATSLVFLTIVGSLLLGPMYLGYYGSLESINVPVPKIAMSMIIAIVTPLVLGQLTRHYLLVRKHVPMRRVKPYLSVVTMICMLSLIFLLIMSKAPIIVRKPSMAFTIILGQATIILAVLGILAMLTKALRIGYGKHAAIAFISISKNESAATIISAVALGGAATVAPAIIPAIQPVLCILYLHLLSRAKRVWGISK